MKAAIVLITYNNQRDVIQAIESVCNQSFLDWQCVTIDNGSTDDTFNVIKKLVGDDSRFTSFQKSNEGPSAGRNMGFSKLEYDVEYVHFLDGDDMLDPEFLSKMISYLEVHPEVGLLGCQYDIINEAGDFVSKGHRSRFGVGFLGFPKELSDNLNKTPFISFFASTGQGAFSVFRTRIFGQTKGYEKSFWAHEDSDIFCQMALLSEVHYIPDHLYKVRVRGDSLSKSVVKRPRLFRKKWDYYQSDKPEINALIEKSLKYYYTRHKPLRDFKVGLKSLRGFITSHNTRALLWAMECFNSGLIDLFLHRNYKDRMRKRELQKRNVFSKDKQVALH